MYSDSTAQIKLPNGDISGVILCNKGVRQGDPLSPLLFCLYIDDLSRVLNQTLVGLHLINKIISCIFYADDLVILSEDALSLTKALTTLEVYAKQNYLIINPQKTQIIKFHRNSTVNTPNPCFCVCGVNVSCSETVKYLGLEFNSSLSNKNMFTNAITKTKRSIAVLNSLFPFCKFLHPKLTKMLYYSYVVSMLSYGSPLWAYNLSKLPDFNCTFVKKIYNLPLNTSHCLIKKELCLDHPKECLIFQQFKYLCRIVNAGNIYLTDCLDILLHYPTLYKYPLRDLNSRLCDFGLKHFLDIGSLNGGNCNLFYNILMNRYKDSVANEVISHYCNSHFLGTTFFNDSLSYWFLPYHYRHTLLLIRTNSLLKPLDVIANGIFCRFCGLLCVNAEKLIFHIIINCPVAVEELSIPTFTELELINTFKCDFSYFNNNLDVSKSIIEICHRIRFIYLLYMQR